MKGHIQRRGANSWRLKFDAGRDPATDKRRIQYQTFRGTKREAQVKLAELITSVANSSYVEPTKIRVGDFVRDRINKWEAAGQITARTAEGYRVVCEHRIVPHLGAKFLQKLRPMEIENWHGVLRSSGRANGKGGISPRSIGHAHRVLSKALSEAVENELIVRNVAATKSVPKVQDEEMTIVRDIPRFRQGMRGDNMEVPAMIALFTGMRLSEILALRWSRVDLSAKVIQVHESVEFTKAHGIRFKSPKTKAGRREITLPDVLVDLLRKHQAAQQELRLKVGAGRLPENWLLLASVDGVLPSRSSMSSSWHHRAGRIGMPDVTFHALRHTHASLLIDEGVDIVTISHRLGHAKPDITLRTYAHLFRKDDGKAAAAINTAMGR